MIPVTLKAESSSFDMLGAGCCIILFHSMQRSLIGLMHSSVALLLSPIYLAVVMWMLRTTGAGDRALVITGIQVNWLSRAPIATAKYLTHGTRSK